MPKRFTASFLCFCLVLSGCASSEKKYSSQQKQQLETNVIEGTYNNVFNATRTVFLNSGLVLKEVNKESGFIRSEITADKKRSKGRYALFLLGIIGVLIFITVSTKDPGEQSWDVTATLNDLGNNSVEVRLQTPLLEKQSIEYGIALKRIFAEITKQTMILEAAGRA